MKLRLPCILLLLPLGLLASCTDIGASSSSSKLGQITYDYTFMFDQTERHMKISPEGNAQIRENTSTSASTIREATVQLSPEEMHTLNTLFHDWHKLKSNYPVALTSPTIYISYNGYQILAGGGESTPESYMNVKAELDKIISESLDKAASAPSSAAMP